MATPTDDPTPDPTPDPAPDPTHDPTPPPPEPPPAAPTQADLDKAYRKLREAEAERDRLAREAKAREDAEKSDLQKAQDRVAELEGQVSASTSQLQRAHLLVALAKQDLGIAPDAVDLVAEKVQVEYDADGKPQDVKDAVEAVLSAYPSLRARPAAGGSSPGAPASGRQRGGAISADDAARLAREDPAKFNEMVDKGEIPASVFGG